MGNLALMAPPPPGMGNQGVALRWYAVSRWDMASPQRGGCISARGATPGTLGQVFLDLPHIGIALGRREEDAGDVHRHPVGIGGLFLRLHGLEQRVVFDGIIDGRGGEDGIEARPQVAASAWRGWLR